MRKQDPMVGRDLMRGEFQILRRIGHGGMGTVYEASQPKMQRKVAIKVLAALLWSVSVRCEPCVVHYAHKAVELGASKEELAEMLAVASTMGGCVGETWALKALAATRAAERAGDGQAACCTHEG